MRPIIVILLIFALLPLIASSGADASLHKSQKSLSTARLLSILGTTIPVAAGGTIAILGSGGNSETSLYGIPVSAVGIVFGPGFGHAYAGNNRQRNKGTLIRLGGLIVTGVGGLMISAARGGYPSIYSTPSGSAIPGTIICLAGLGICTVSTVHDFRTLDDSVHSYNEALQSMPMQFVPKLCYRFDEIEVMVIFQF